MEVSSDVIKDPMLCSVEGCTNHRANAGYRHYRAVCEKHHRQKAHVPRSRVSKRHLLHNGLAMCRELLERGRVSEVFEKIGELEKLLDSPIRF